MIKKLKIKFILLSMLSLFILLTVIVAGMNIINYLSMVKESDEILSLLSQNKGRFPDLNATAPAGNRLPHNMSPELPYESRFFSVLLDENGNVIQTDTSRITAVDEDSAINYAKTVQQADCAQGFIDAFRYVKSTEENTIRITFLDCGRKIDSYNQFLLTSIGMACGGLIIVFFVIFFFSGKIIRPIAESYEKQKRFITDAGHEIKTPLTIIRTNADLLKMDLGENECLDDIQQQADRLTTLTEDLVYLARMEESAPALQMIDFPLSDLVSETVNAFKALVQTQNKQLQCDIQPLLSMRGNDKAIRQLVSILMDNALKYSPTEGTICVFLAKQNRAIHFHVINTTQTAIDPQSMSHVFDRFYRADASRNSQTGGHGIGLSIAKAIVHAHSGKIQAWSPDDHSFGIYCTFPT